MSDCLIVGDTFEQEDWFRVSFIQPPNGEQLHAQDLIEYTWGLPTAPSVGNLNLYEKIEGDREAHYKYSKVMAIGDPDTVDYTINVKARDLRFQSLDISDTEEADVTVDLPCVEAGNAPNFSINDVQIFEPKTGQQNLTFTVTASEAVTGTDITLDFCTEDGTASSTSTSVEVKHVAYDKNTPPEPFISYLDFGDVRVVFDASFPKFYNARYTDSNFANAWKLFDNVINWTNRKGGTRALFTGDLADAAANYSIKNTGGAGFYNSIRVRLQSLGYTVDTLYHNEVGSDVGNPTPAELNVYDVIVFMSSAYLAKTNPPLSNTFVNSIENAIRSRVGCLIVTDHGDGGAGFNTGGNQIANRFFATFSGNIDRSVGTDFDEVRATYGDHPLISGITGFMPGDGSEGKIETTPQVIVEDYVRTCGTLTFAVGESSKTVNVPINADTTDELAETFKMKLSNASRGNFTKAEGIGTINLPPTIITELAASNNVTVNSMIYLDTSGSTYQNVANSYENPEVTTNSVLSSRRFLMEQIIIDYDLLDPSALLLSKLGISSFANRDPVSLVSHVDTNIGLTIDKFFDNKNNNEYIPKVGGDLKKVVEAINEYVTGKTFTSSDHVNIFIMTDAADGDGGLDVNTVWANELAAFPKTMKSCNLTIVRVAASKFWTSANYVAAETMFNTFIAQFEALDVKFKGEFETFETYTTGADSELNRIINQTFADQYTAYCNVHGVGSAITIFANSLQEAETQAAGAITCP